MDSSGHTAMMQTGGIRLCAARECRQAADRLADQLEAAGIKLCGAGDEMSFNALMLVVSPKTSYEALRAPILAAGIRRAGIVVVQTAPHDLPEEVRHVLRDATVCQAASGTGEEPATAVVGALQRCGVLLQKPLPPIRPLP